MKGENDVIERHNARDLIPGDSGTIRAKTKLEKRIQRQSALSFKDCAAWLLEHGGIAKGRAFEVACTECAEKRTKEVIKIIKKTT